LGEDGGIDGLLSAAAWRTCTARSCAGRTHALGLSAIGRAEITAVANRLAEYKINALYSSPLQRTRETAEILSERLNLSVAYRDDSLKLDFGDGSNGSAINQVGYNTHYLPPTGQKVVAQFRRRNRGPRRATQPLVLPPLSAISAPCTSAGRVQKRAVA